MHTDNALYVENPQKSEYARRIYCDAVTALSENGFAEYEKNPNAPLLADTLGAPLNLKITHIPTLSHEYVGRDSLCEIFRLRINVLPNLPFFGLLFIPHNAEPPAPLCIACHGYLGTPELMYGMHGKNGYSGLIEKLLQNGFAVFSPQLLTTISGNVTTVYPFSTLEGIGSSSGKRKTVEYSPLTEISLPPLSSL